MKNIQKIFSLFLVIFFLTPTTSIRCDEIDDLENLSFDDLLESSIVNNILETTAFEFQRTKFKPEDTVDILEDIGILDILKQNLYLRSNRLNYRSVIDLPMGMMDKDYCYIKRLFGMEFFFNKMDRARFTSESDANTCGSDAICSYLALTDKDFLEALSKSTSKSEELAEADFDFDPAEVFDLFKCGTVQERKLGVMLYGRAGTEKWRFTYKIPFYYLERNLWITEPEQKKIEEQLGEADPEQQEQFQDQHAISDKLGIGDFRIGFDFRLTNHERSCSRIGGFATVPTGWAMIKGLKGQHFKPLIRSPETNLNDLIGYHLDAILSLGTGTEQEKAQAKQSLTDLSFQAIDHLNSILLEAPMGNNGHFGVGAVLRSMWRLDALVPRPWAKNIWMKGRLTLEYLFPGTEMRFFAENPSPKLYDPEFIKQYPESENALENMLFTEKEIVGKLFPYALECTVCPGFVFCWTSRWYHEREWWGIYLGSEYWMRSKEKFSDLQKPKFLEDRICVERARAPFAFQSKWLGGLYFKINRSNRNLVLSLNGETSFWNRGIGGDYTVSFDLEFNF